MRWRSLFRLPSFRTAFIGSVVVLLASVGWVFVDASFPGLLDWDLWRQPSLWVFTIGPWPYRALFFVVLGSTGTASGILVLYRLFFGDRKGRSLRNLLLVVALAAMWMGLLVSYTQLRETGLRWRICRMLPGLKQDASKLVANWPPKEGELPFLGAYTATDSEPPVLFVDPPIPLCYFRLRERVHSIQKSGGGRVRFWIEPSYGPSAWIEYRADGSRPDLNRNVQLEPHWFLVWNQMALGMPGADPM